MKRYRLGDIAIVKISGIDKKTKAGETAIRLCNFTDVYNNWAITNNMYNGLMKATASENDIESFLLQKGMVAITKDSETRDDIGVATYIADDFEDVVLGYHCALIVPKDDIPEEQRVCGKFLNALLHTKYAQKYFYNNATGSGQRYTLSKDSIEDMPIFLPSFIKQLRIGNFLSDMDKKIEVNNLIISELEAIAKQIFNYWFIQFEFPNDEGKPYKSSGGKMVWNDELKSDIPEKWDVDIIASCLGKVTSTPRLFTDEYLESGKHPIIDQTNGVYFAGFTNREDAVSSQYPAVIFGDHSCAVKYVNFPYSRGADGTQVMISEDNRISCEFLYFAVKNIRIDKGYARHYSLIKDSKIIIPIETIAEKFKMIVQQLFVHSRNKRFENLHYERLRSSLLPLFMNGQITIKD